MTGYGEARHQSDNLSVTVELRAVNNRHLKLVVRATEPYNLFEPEVEKTLRKSIRRGTIQVHIRCDRQALATDYRLNLVALGSYVNQIRKLAEDAALDASVTEGMMARAVALPGVAPEPGMAEIDTEHEWPLLERVLEDAVTNLQSMRREEGSRMAKELLAMCDHTAAELEQIRQR